VTVPVLGRGPVPSSGVAAVVVSLTAIDASGSGFLTAYPAGRADPVASNVNFARGQETANSAIVPVGSNGAIDVYASAGAPNIAIDVEGYVTDASNPSIMGAVMVASPTPVRICDTRPGNPSGLSGAALVNCEGKAMLAGSTMSIQATGLGGVPPDATAVIVNLTATDTTASSHLTAWATGSSRPLASPFNWEAGATRADLAIVPVGSGGRISIYNYAGSAAVVVDVVGWLLPVGP
jgi:hypothetical protein